MGAGSGAANGTVRVGGTGAGAGLATVGAAGKVIGLVTVLSVGAVAGATKVGVTTGGVGATAGGAAAMSPVWVKPNVLRRAEVNTPSGKKVEVFYHQEKLPCERP